MITKSVIKTHLMTQIIRAKYLVALRTLNDCGKLLRGQYNTQLNLL